MASLVNIYNKALAHVGASRITSEADENNRAQVCNDMYEFALKATLESREWSFATRRSNLLPDPSITPAWGYDYAYQLPFDTIRVAECRNGQFNSNTAWEVEGKYLYSTQPRASLKIIFLQENTLRFSPSFVEMLAIKLASDICIPLTENRALSMDLLARFEQQKGEASALDGLQASRERLRSDTLINARYGVSVRSQFAYQDGTGDLDSKVPDGGTAPPVTPLSGTITGPSSVQLGDPYTYTALVEGVAPITFQWQKDGINIPSAVSSVYTDIAAETDEAGIYRCIFTNISGTTASNEINLIIGCVAPTASVSGPSNVDRGDSFTMSAVNVNGNQPITFQWQLDGADIPSATDAQYTKSAVESDTGAYRVLVSNACASDISSSNSVDLAVEITQAPSISITPPSASPIAPDVTTFTCNIDSDGGDPAVSYQWYLGGAAVGSNSPTYTTPASVANTPQIVECTATNIGGVSNRPVAVVNPLSNLISETSFANGGPLTLNAATTYVQAQGCGGGAAGGDGRSSGGVSGKYYGNGGGGGASIVFVLSSAAVGGSGINIAIGGGGSRVQNGDGGDGGSSSVSGGGITGLSWQGGKGGKKGLIGTTATYGGGGGAGGHSSAGIGGGAGGLSANNAGANGGPAAGGGAGYHHNHDDKGGKGGNGGGDNGGAGREGPSGNDNWGGSGGGGGNSAVWWDGAAKGAGGRGTRSSSVVSDIEAHAASGNGNGGGGGNGSTGTSGTPYGSKNGSAGRVIIRQYRRTP